MPMEERCEFIWQIIEESPELNAKMQELEDYDLENYDEKVYEIISFFRDMDEIIDCVVDSYNQTKILNRNSYLLRMRG